MYDMVYATGAEDALQRLGIKHAGLADGTLEALTLIGGAGRKALRGAKSGATPPPIPKSLAPKKSTDIFQGNANRGAAFEGKVRAPGPAVDTTGPWPVNQMEGPAVDSQMRDMLGSKWHGVKKNLGSQYPKTMGEMVDLGSAGRLS
jgi:hypothetical protein